MSSIISTLIQQRLTGVNWRLSEWVEMDLENMQEWETFRFASLSMVAMVPDTMWLSQATGMHQDLI